MGKLYRLAELLILRGPSRVARRLTSNGPHATALNEIYGRNANRCGTTATGCFGCEFGVKMIRQRIILALFLTSAALNFAYVLSEPHWLALPALLLGWYLADLFSGLVHMYMDYRPCTPGKRLDDLFFYEGSRESDEYLAMLSDRMATVNAFERISYDFKNHHPRPDALGRRPLWRLIGSTVIVAALPLSLLGNISILVFPIPSWAMAGLVSFLAGGAFAQYFHGSLHRLQNPWFVNALRSTRLLMTPAAHQIHHDTLRRDFATNCGWSNPVINRLFLALERQGRLDAAGLIPPP